MTPAEKVRELKMRRMAARQGFMLNRSRLRDPKALGYGRYALSEHGTGKPVFGLDDRRRHTATLDEIEVFLNAPSEKRIADKFTTQAGDLQPVKGTDE